MDTQYTNPFHPDTIRIAELLDECMLAGDWNKQRELLADIEKRIDDFDAISQANLFYCLGTTYGSINEREHDIHNIEKQFLFFQKSINILMENQSLYPDSMPYILGLLLPLFTNYANLLDLCGRKIPAIKYYLSAIEIKRDFSMALGNLGRTYHHYATLMWNHVPRDYFNYCAYIYLSRSIEANSDVFHEAINGYIAIRDGYNSEYIEFLEKNLDMGEYQYTGEEEKYREWAMSNRLFLNPLNDLPFHDFYIATDDIHLPDMIVRVGEKPVLHGLYNQLKQEYVFSRFLFYESLQETGTVHFADKETCLFQFADYPSYSVRVEKMKTSFRIAYSLLDKIGFFLNQYFALGIFERDISYTKVWRRTKLSARDKFTNILQPEQNFALTALQWLGKELFAGKEAMINPDELRISEIRNALEHKYVKVFNDIFPARTDGEVDDLAFYISEKELEKYTYDLLSLLREALINLSISVHIEEMKKRSEIDPNVVVPSIDFLNYEDEWKV